MSKGGSDAQDPIKRRDVFFNPKPQPLKPSHEDPMAAAIRQIAELEQRRCSLNGKIHDAYEAAGKVGMKVPTLKRLITNHVGQRDLS